jgi:protein-L-isoaspartate O-methyltransferase
MLHHRPLAVAAALIACLLCGTRPAAAQERFSLFVGSDPKTVERMVRLAGLRDGETVMDMGSGDGRVVFAAAQANPTVRGIGVDIDAKLVQQASARAAELELSDRVRFEHLNAFDADLSQVDVVFMWFFPELMRLLRVKILDQARPGTRVVAPLWGFGSWPPDASDKEPTEVNLWVVPAKVGGYWDWQLNVGGQTRSYAAILEQRFQSFEGVVRTGARHGIFHDMKLHGADISFVLMMTLPDLGFTRHEFSGRVNGDTMQGAVKITLPPVTNEEDEELETLVLPWQAKRVPTSAFLAPAGVNIR